MSRMHRAVFLSISVALLHVSLVGACMNDRETIRAESEFKKRYEFKSGHTDKSRPVESSTTDKKWVPIAATFSGVGFLAGSIALIRLNVRRRRS